MKNNFSQKSNLLRNLTWWILGLALAFPLMFILDYLTGWALFYPGMADMELARTQQLRLELTILAISNAIAPILISALEIYCADLTINKNKEHEKIYFTFLFDLTRFKQPVSNILTRILIVIGKSLIIAMIIYLIQNYDRALISSMDFLIGGPSLIILFAYILLVIDCFLILCLLLFSFLWGYTWVQWLVDRFFPNFFDNNMYSRTLLLFSLIFRSLNMLGVFFVINLITTFSGNFISVVNLIFGITILLVFWTAIYIVPYLREKAKVSFRTVD